MTLELVSPYIEKLEVECESLFFISPTSINSIINADIESLFNKINESNSAIHQFQIDSSKLNEVEINNDTHSLFSAVQPDSNLEIVGSSTITNIALDNDSFIFRDKLLNKCIVICKSYKVNNNEVLI